MTAANVYATTTRLADGRELIYFDDTPDRPHDEFDQRDLVPVNHAGEIRWDPLAGEWVIIAAHRQGRTHLPADDECPLCPSRDGRLTEIPAPDYDVVVFENRFPSLSGLVCALDDVDTGGLVARRPARGRCEVVCYSSDHEASLRSLPALRLATVMEAWCHRSAALAATPGVEYVFVFENRGQEIGVTLTHPHGQIYGYPFVPPTVQRMHENLRAHERRHGENLFGRVLVDEQRSGRRIVAETEHWVGLVPAAARWPVEVHVYPRRQVATLPELDPTERAGFCALYGELLGRLDALFEAPLPFIAAWYQAPLADRRGWWLHLRVASVRRSPHKIKYLAGSESAMGVFINDITPEAVAERLRG